MAQLFKRTASKPIPGTRRSRPHSTVPSTSALIKDCRAREQGLRQGAISQLIQQVWVERQAAAEAITVSTSTLAHELAGQRRALGGATGYARYLKRVGQTAPQAAEQLRFSLLEQQLQQRRLGPPVSVSNGRIAAFFAAHHAEFALPGQPNPKLSTYAARIRLVLAEQVRAQRAVAATTAFERRWRAQTICRPGYVVPVCANAA